MMSALCRRVSAVLLIGAIDIFTQVDLGDETEAEACRLEDGRCPAWNNDHWSSGHQSAINHRLKIE
jgi:hypothetical protein